MFMFHKETVSEDLGNGVTRRVLAHGGRMMAVEVQFEQGAIGPLHNHPHEQLTYVLSGEFEFTIGEEKHVVTAGDTLYKTTCDARLRLPQGRHAAGHLYACSRGFPE